MLLVAAQLALSLALVAGAASIVTSALRFNDIDPGFDRNGILAVKVAFTGNAYAQPAQRFAFIDAATNRLRAVNGVTSVAAASHLPLIDRDVSYTSFASRMPRRRNGSLLAPFASWTPATSPPCASPLASGTRFYARGGARLARSRHRHQRPDGEALLARPRSDRSATAFNGKRGKRGLVHHRRRRRRGQPAPAPGCAGESAVPAAGSRERGLADDAHDFASTPPIAAREAVQGIDRSLAVSTGTMNGAYECARPPIARSGRRHAGRDRGAARRAQHVRRHVDHGERVRKREIAIRMAHRSSAAGVLRLVLTRSLLLTAAGWGGPPARERPHRVSVVDLPRRARVRRGRADRGGGVASRGRSAVILAARAARDERRPDGDPKAVDGLSRLVASARRTEHPSASERVEL